MLVFVFPGQGSQSPGFLAPWLELPGVADRLRWASAVVGDDLVAHGTVSDAGRADEVPEANALTETAALDEIALDWIALAETTALDGVALAASEVRLRDATEDASLLLAAGAAAT